MHNLNIWLKLSYSPMTIYEFNQIKSSETFAPDIFEALKTTKIYIIAKRKLPIMEFAEPFSPNKVTIKVKNEDEDNYLRFSFSKKYNKDLFGEGITRIKLGSNLQRCKDWYAGGFNPRNDKFPFQAITFYKGNGEFFLNANFDRFWYLHSNNSIKLSDFEGNIEPFITYEVLYVGKYDNEHIFYRFKHHHALQDLLIKEKIIPKDYDKANDLMILPFYVENEVITLLNDESFKKELMNSLIGQFPFSNQNIILDAEKALVNALSPKYNKVKFKSYPKSKDGLYNKKLSLINYSIREDIILRYGENYIRGDVKGLNLTVLSVDGNDFQIVDNIQYIDILKMKICSDFKDV